MFVSNVYSYSSRGPQLREAPENDSFLSHSPEVRLARGLPSQANGVALRTLSRRGPPVQIRSRALNEFSSEARKRVREQTDLNPASHSPEAQRSEHPGLSCSGSNPVPRIFDVNTTAINLFNH